MRIQYLSRFSSNMPDGKMLLLIAKLGKLTTQDTCKCHVR